MSSHSSDCFKISPIAKDLISSVDLEWLAHEISLVTSEHVLLSSNRGVFILELDCKICSVNQLTPQQFASLTEQLRFQIFSYMANDPNSLEGHLNHCRGRR